MGRRAHGGEACGFDGDKAPWLATALRARITELGHHQTFGLEALQRRVDVGASDGTSGTPLDFVRNRNGIGLIGAKSQRSQQHEEFELGKGSGVVLTHLSHIVTIYGVARKEVPARTSAPPVQVSPRCLLLHGRGAIIDFVTSSWSNARLRFYHRVANACLLVRWYAAAVAVYDRMLRISLDNSTTQFQRAWTLLQLPKRRSESIAAFQTLLKQQPSASGYYLLACGLQHERRHADAVEAFEEALRLDSPAPAAVYYDYAGSLWHAGRLEDAAEACRNDAAPVQERAVRWAPSLTNGLNLADTLCKLDRAEEAERVLSEVRARAWAQTVFC